MEMAKDLNMESDEMQLVVSALRGVKKKLWKWQKRTSRTIATERLSPTRRLQGRYFTDCLTYSEF